MHSWDSLFQNLEKNGWAFSDRLLPEGLEIELFSECQKAWQEGLFHEAQIGRGREKSRKSDIRGDSILWLDPETGGPATLKFLKWSADLRHELNQRYFLGLRSEEFHFARYPPGTGYQKHVDQHRGTQARKISLALYLNPLWHPEDGGELCIYSPDDDSKELQRLTPQGGRGVLFRSDLIPHEVRPSRQIRWSLTGWFRDDLSLSAGKI